MSQILREKTGLVYTSSVITEYYEHMGNISFYVESDNKKIIKDGNKNGLLVMLINIINDLIKNGITDEEIRVAKGYKHGKITMHLENSDTITSYNGKQYLLYGSSDKIVNYKDYYDRFYKNITTKEINDVILKYFKKQNMNVCMVGEKLPQLNLVKNICERLHTK